MKSSLIKTSILITALLLVLAFATATFAWIFTGDIARGMEYSIAKIDSSVTLYRAVDDNMNGVPNRLGEPLPLKYYVEQYEFTQIGDEKFALSDTSEANTLTTVSITDLVPTQIYTLKYALVNKSSAENLITFKLASATLDNAALLSTLSIRLGIVSAETTDSAATVEFGEKIYLADCITGNTFNETELRALGESIFIDGMTGPESPDNYCDFWLQIEMESYEELSARDGFSLTEEEYNALQGKSAALPYLYIYFEIVI